MNLSIVGTSSIVKQHIVAAVANGFTLVDICTTNKKSKNLKKLYKDFKFKKKFYSTNEMLRYHKSNNIKCFYLIACRINDLVKISETFLEQKKVCLIEKPVSIELKKIKKLLKYENQIFVGYNRIFYSSIEKIKKMKMKNRLIKIQSIEKNKKSFLENSCHIISIINYLFNIKKIKKIVSTKSFKIVTMEDNFKNFFVMHIFFNANKNFSIEFFGSKNNVKLKPIEKLFKFDKIKKIRKLNENFYIENKKLMLNEYNTNKFKPGFFEMWKNFKKFTKIQNSGLIRTNIKFAENVMKISNKIINA